MLSQKRPSMDSADENGPDEADFDLDDNLVHLGIRGFFPSGIYFILSFFVFLTPMQYMSSHVSSFTPQHHCKLPLVLSNASSTTALKPRRYSREDVIPKSVDKGLETFASCERFEFIEEAYKNGRPCTAHYIAHKELDSNNAFLFEARRALFCSE